MTLAKYVVTVEITVEAGSRDEVADIISSLLTETGEGQGLLLDWAYVEGGFPWNKPRERQR